MARMILGILAGFAVWTAAWLGGNLLFFQEAADRVKRKEPLTDPMMLATVLTMSAICSLLAGLTTALVVRPRKALAVFILSLFLLGTGVAVQAGSWDLMPLWYHLTFLGLLLPVAFIGSFLVKSEKKPD